MTVAGIIVVLLVVDQEMALVTGAVLPVLALATVSFWRRSRNLYRLTRQRLSALHVHLHEQVTGLRAVQAYGRAADSVGTFTTLSDHHRRAQMRTQLVVALYFPFVSFLAPLTTLLVLASGAGRIHDGTLTPGTLIAALIYVQLLFAPVQQLALAFDTYQQAVTSFDHLHGLLDTPATLQSSTRPRARPVPVLRGSIAFDQVTFTYPRPPQASPSTAPRVALSDVTLHIPAGQRVAFVGESGAGKSTLLKLVSRLYDPTTGTVRVDGVDLRDNEPAEYRRHLGVVPQEPHLFAGTVRDNIAYGLPQATDRQIQDAARAVDAHETITALPGGYHHDITERGHALSAGQRQLICLARAALVDPAILLLDEATASLDPATQHLVTTAVNRLAQGRTTLIVAHHLTTAARTDRIIVLDRGRPVQDGTHTDLLATLGPYRQLWTAHTAHTHRGSQNSSWT
ncbi:ABC transporter ATP-binding protein [Streptomyces cinereoruber]|uniref:ABC transporter ATP-binding protein n=1 Tax=Streptomyces cinereoruber TaxID=67260 RepID=UPI003627B915